MPAMFYDTQQLKFNKAMIKEIKNILNEDFDKWEMWLYAVVLPIGFGASVLIGWALACLSK